MRRIIGSVFLMLWLPLLVSAQDARASWNNLKQLQAGEKIEVVDMKLKSFKGTFLSFSEEVISVRVKEDDVVIERAKVLRVTDREHSKRGRNMILGVAIGAGAGLAAGILIDEGVRHVSGEGGSYLFAPVLAGAGAALGALAGLPSGYRTIYRAEVPRASAGP